MEKGVIEMKMGVLTQSLKYAWCEIWDMGCRIWDEGRGMRGVGCGMKGVGCGWWEVMDEWHWGP